MLDAATTADAAGALVLAAAWPIDLRLTVASHGWVQLAPWSWDAGEGRLARRERGGGRVATIDVAQQGKRSVAVRWEGLPENIAVARVRRWLSADWDPAPAIAALRPALSREAALIARGGGRVLRCSTFYEDFVKTLLTVNTSWSGTLRMNAALVDEPGGGAFPEPGMILDYGERRLREEAKLGFRAPSLVAATERMLADGAIDAAGNGGPGYDYLIGLKGIGPYAAAHCGVLLQDFARLPVDTSVTAYLRARLGCDAAEFATRHAGCGAYLALAYRLMRLCDKLETAGPSP